MQQSDNYNPLELKITELEKQLKEQTEISNSLKMQLQATLSTEETTNRTKTEFLSNMSHEMRTPLHAILGFAEMGEAKSGTAKREKLNAYFEHIHASGKRLLLLLNDLLDLAKFDSGQVQMLFKNANLFNSLENIVEQFESLLKNKNIQIELNKPEFQALAFVDIERTDQVFINILSNAIKFSEQNGRIQITLTKTRNFMSAPMICIAIRDEGIGVPANELDSIFDKFVQSSATNIGDGGTGLGLSICREIVNRHLGEIWAENNKEKGATFFFTLPLAQ